MKTIAIYEFAELPEDMQHYVHEHAGYMEYPWGDEDWDSWKTFVKDLFPDVVKDWSYGYRDTWITCQDNDWSEMHGKELHDHLSNILSRLDECPTGYCADDYCYGYVRHNLDKIIEKDMTAEELVEDTFSHFCDFIESNEEWCQSFEYFAEEAEANDYHYTKDGQRIYI